MNLHTLNDIFENKTKIPIKQILQRTLINLLGFTKRFYEKFLPNNQKNPLSLL